MPSTTPWFLRARLKTRQLMLLIAIGDEGNIHRAAEILNMSQPAASKLLKGPNGVTTIPGATHSLASPQAFDAAVEAAVAWFQKYL